MKKEQRTCNICRGYDCHLPDCPNNFKNKYIRSDSQAKLPICKKCNIEMVIKTWDETKRGICISQTLECEKCGIKIDITDDGNQNKLRLYCEECDKISIYYKDIFNYKTAICRHCKQIIRNTK